MSQYPESGYNPAQPNPGQGRGQSQPQGQGQPQGRNPGLSGTGQYNSLSGTGQFATGAFSSGSVSGTGQFATGPEAEARRRAAADAAVNAFPRHVVTAVLVSHDGARWLDDSLNGLLGQLRAPQRVLAVDTGSKDDSLTILDEHLGPEAVLQAKRNTGFGTAINHALKQAPPASYDDYGYNSGEPIVEWIWILHDDAEPAPDALLRLLEVADASSPQTQDVAVVGPKIRGWEDREQLLEVGVTVTADGRRWTGLEAGEHDQGQHADPTQVLSVSSAGMLVRRDVWDRLKGFDRAIPMFRDDLDFCWRVNHAGLQVLTAPKAVLWHAEASARAERRISAGVARPHFEDRQHALYTLTVNHDGRFLPLTFLRLFLWSFVRGLGLMLAKEPGRAADEVLAALAYAGRIDRIVRARRFRKRTRSSQPVDLSPLFPSRVEVFRHTFEEATDGFRNRNGQDDDTGSRNGTGETGPVSEEAESYDAGVPFFVRAMRMPGVIVGVVLTLVTLVSARSVLTGGELMGGALLPAPTGASDLWSSFAAAWHPVGTGSTSASPPYLAVVALFATLFFGKGSFAVSFLLIGSVPMAGLSAYAVLRRTVDSNPLRVWGALAYALLPAATGAISAGRLGSAVGIVVLPLVASGVLLAIGGPGRQGSIRAAWSAAFAIAVATAFAPITWILAVALAVGAAVTVFWRSTADLVTVLVRLAILLLTPLAVLAPWSLDLVKHPGAFLLEPGLPLALTKAPAPTALLLANPGGPGTYVYWLTGGLLVAALAALVRTGPRRRITFAAWTLAFAGFAAGLLALQTRPTALSGGLPQQPWTGIPTAAIGFGLVVAAVIGAEGARDYFRTSGFSWRQPAALVLAIAALAAPLGASVWWVTSGVDGPIQRAAADFRPATVAVDASYADQSRALILGQGSQTAIGYGVVGGDGAVLGDADYAISSARAAWMNNLVGGLLSDSGGTQVTQLASAGIQWVVASKTVSDNDIRILNGTPGLTAGGPQNGTHMWKLTQPAARLALRDTSGAVVQPMLPAGTKNPAALTYDSASNLAMKAEIPAGAEGRTLVLAHDADTHWKATVGGKALKQVTVDGWAQGFEAPAAGGVVTIDYSKPSRTFWLFGETLLFLFALVMALPTGRRAEQPTPEDDFEPPTSGREAAGGGGGRRGAPAPEPEPEYEAEHEPEYEPQAEVATKYADETEYADDYATGYAPSYDGYEEPETVSHTAGSGRRRGSGEYDRPDLTGYESSGSYPRHGTGEFERPDFSADYDQPEQAQAAPGFYEQPTGYEQPAPYQRYGSGEYQRPDLDGLDDYDGYGSGSGSGHGNEGGYR